jgi:N utilization substance protein A
MKLDTMMEAIEVLARERGVSVDTILDAFANALVAAYKRSPGAAEEARVTIDPESGEVMVYAQELDEDGNVIDEWEDTPEGEAFGRIAAQSFKQVMQFKLREAKRELVYEMYEGRAISVTLKPSSPAASEFRSSVWSGGIESRRSSSRSATSPRERR